MFEVFHVRDTSSATESEGEGTVEQWDTSDTNSISRCVSVVVRVCMYIVYYTDVCVFSVVAVY